MDSRIPFWPSQTATMGGGSLHNNLSHVVPASYGTQHQPTTYSGVRAIRQTWLPTRIPSRSRMVYTSPLSTGLGAISQHHSVCLRQVRAEMPSSSWDFLPRSQVTKRSSTNAWLRSARGFVALLLQVTHSQRWVPALVRPRFCRVLPHVGQRYL